MEQFVVYQLNVAACIAVFYLFYKVLLSRETFHRLNRTLLLGAMAAALLLPVCRVTRYREVVVDSLTGGWLAGEELADVASAGSIDWMTIVGLLLAAGSIVVLGMILQSARRIVRLIRRGSRQPLALGEENRFGGVLVRVDGEVAPFSWLRWIVISERDLAENGRTILAHEREHLRLRHGVDLIVTDLLTALQWFNPMMWLLRDELRAIHEYEADAAVLAAGADAREYQLLLIKKAVGERWYSVANSLNHSKLKNRITMMLRKKSSRAARAKTLFVVPLMCVGAAAFARTVYLPVEDKGSENLSNSEIVGQPAADTITVGGGRVGIVTTSCELRKPLYVVDGEVVEDIGTLESKVLSVRVDRNPAQVARRSAELGVAQGDWDAIVDVKTEKSADTRYASQMDRVRSLSDSTAALSAGRDDRADRGSRGRYRAGIIAVDGDPEVREAEHKPIFQKGSVDTFRKWVTAKAAGIVRTDAEGRVWAAFTVGTDGRVGEIKVVSSPDRSLSEAVVAVLQRSPRWRPGRNGSRRVTVRYLIPVDFRHAPSAEQ